MFKKKCNECLRIYCFSFLKKEKKSKDVTSYLISTKVSTKIIFFFQNDDLICD